MTFKSTKITMILASAWNKKETSKFLIQKFVPEWFSYIDEATDADKDTLSYQILKTNVILPTLGIKTKIIARERL